MEEDFIYMASNYTSGLTVTNLPTGGTLLDWSITGSFAPHTSGAIIVQTMVSGLVASGTTLFNTVSIGGIRLDVSGANNTSVASVYVIGDPSFGTTGQSSSTGGGGGGG